MDWDINGTMSKSLIHITQRTNLIFLLILFLIIAPLFYFTTNYMYLREIDESLLLEKTDFLHNFSHHLTKSQIEQWNKYNSKIKILEYNGFKHDTLFNSLYYNYVEKEYEPYRELNSFVLINGKPYTLSIKTNLLEFNDIILTVLLLFIVIIVLSFTGIFFINKNLSKKIWKPFYNTLQQIENFEIDKNYRPQFSQTQIMEFNRLNNSIENLIERNITIFNNQREFVENAAHELQTPIAVFKAKIDTLIQRSDISKEQAEILESLNQTVSRLNRLNKNLLLLSKIDKQQFSQTETISIKKLIENQLDFFIEQAKQKNIEIKVDLKSDIVISANLGLTEIMINNLILNAIKHNISSGIIKISITENKLIISNTGQTEKLSDEKLFVRFYKAKATTEGHGLGLAIVKKITELYHWTLTYSFSENLHTFLINFNSN